MLVIHNLPTFESVLDNLDGEFAKRIRRRPIFRQVFAKLAERAPSFIQSAQRGDPPILLCGQDLNDLARKLPANDLSQFVDSSIETILKASGFIRASSVSRSLDPAWIHNRVTTFFRPAEELIFDRLGDSDRVLLFTTQEEHRFVTALLNNRHRLPFGGSVFVWTLASGFLEPSSSASSTLVPTIDPRRSASTLRVIVQRISSLDDGDPRKIAFQESGPGARVIGSYNEDTHSLDAFINDEYGDMGDDEFDQNSASLREQVVRDFDKIRRQRIKDDLKIPPMHRFADGIRKALDPEWPDGLYIFLDVHRELDSGGLQSNLAENVRMIRDAHHNLQSGGAERKLILFGHDFTVPDDLLQEITSIELPLPGRGELGHSIKSVLSEYGHDAKAGENGDSGAEDLLRRVVDAVSGLTLQQSTKAVRMIAERYGEVPPHVADLLQEFKCQQLNSEGVLSLIRELPSYSAGGLDRLSAWLDQRKRVFERPDEAERYGIDRRPKGVLMLGVSGSGKSLAAKLVARDWGLPLLRLDAGAIYDKWVGASEARLRRALRVAETIAPCVLWIDEIEKGFGQGADSSGVSQRVLGSLLVWMQETKAPVFTVATANDITKLPPELTRAGRFDNRFFLGCPGPSARGEILRIHLSKRGHDPERLIDEELIQATHGLTGAELEQVVLDSLYAAYASEGELVHLGLVETAKRVKPLIAVLGNAMEQVWEMVEHGRAELASTDTLSRKDVAQLIDPHRFTPMYCRLKTIGGYERHCERAERVVASQPAFGSAACVLEVEDPQWVYAQCNFPLEKGDEFAFKFLDRISTIETNDVFFMLCREHGLETIIFETEALREKFTKSPYLSELSHLFSVYGVETEMMPSLEPESESEPP